MGLPLRLPDISQNGVLSSRSRCKLPSYQGVVLNFPARERPFALHGGWAGRAAQSFHGPKM